MSFLIGDPVVEVAKGFGVVATIIPDTEYPITVSFNHGTSYHSYTAEGRASSDDLHPILFHAEGYQPPQTGVEPIRFEAGEPVWVKDKDDTTWRVRIFVGKIINTYHTISNEIYHATDENDMDIEVDTVGWDCCKKFNIEAVKENLHGKRFGTRRSQEGN